MCATAFSVCVPYFRFSECLPFALCVCSWRQPLYIVIISSHLSFIFIVSHEFMPGLKVVAEASLSSSTICCAAAAAAACSYIYNMNSASFFYPALDFFLARNAHKMMLM